MRSFDRTMCRCHRHPLFVFLMVFFITSVAPDTHAQDSLIDRLPQYPAVYFWADDASELVDSFGRLREEIGLDLEEALSIEELLSREAKEMPRFRDYLSQLDEQAELMSAVWEQLTDSDLLTGEVAIVMVPELVTPPNEALPQDTPYQVYRDATQLAWTEVVFLAKTKADKEQFSELFASLRDLSSGSKDSSAEQDVDDDEEQHWQVDQGWFCWSYKPETLEEWMAIATGEVSAERPLSKDRNFQKVLKHLQVPHNLKSSCSFYIDGDAIPPLFVQIRQLSQLFSGVRAESWRELFLNELRGFGGKFYFADEELVDELNAPFGFDGFLLVTNPRRGLIQGLAGTSVADMTEALPTLGGTIGSLHYFSLQGEGMHNGIAEIAQRSDSDDPNMAEQMDTMADVFGTFRSIAEVEYVAPDWMEEGQRLFSTVWNGVRIYDPEVFRDVVKGMPPGMDFVSNKQLGGPLANLSSHEVWVAMTSAERLEEMKENYDQNLETMRENLERMKKEAEESGRNSGETEEIIRAQTESLAMMEQSFEDSLERMAQPNLVMVDDYIVFGTSLHDDALAALADNYDRTHPQLEELEEAVLNLQETFANRKPLVGLICHWSAGIWQRSVMRQWTANLENEDWKSAVRERSAVMSLQQLNQIKSLELLNKQIDRYIITISDDDDGLRFNAVSTKPNDEEEE